MVVYGPLTGEAPSVGFRYHITYRMRVRLAPCELSLSVPMADGAAS